MQDRLPPQNIEAEEAVIGSILIDGAAINDVLTVIKPSDFSREKHAQIFDAMMAMHSRSEPINQVTVAHELDSREHLEGVGGRAFLSQTISMVPTTLHVKRYAELVRHASMMRQLIRSAQQIAELGYNDEGDAGDKLAKAADIIYDIRSQQGTGEFKHIKEALDPYYDMSEMADDGRDRISSGFPALDNLLNGGMHRSDMIVLAARPSIGKSALALNIALNAAKEKHTVVVFSLEMGIEQVAMRLIASESQVSMSNLRSRKVNTAQQKQMLLSVATLSALSLYVDDTPFQSVSEMRGKLRRLQLQLSGGIDFVVVDYMQLIEGNQSGRPGNRTQEVTEISRHLKGMARDLNVPVLALSQLSRAIEQRDSKEPQLSDLRESGSIEQDADVVIFISRLDKYMTEEEWNKKYPNTDKNPYPRNLPELVVAKHRHGMTGRVEMAVKDDIGSFFSDRLKPEYKAG